MTADQVTARRAVEALRCGVPSRAVVQQLGSGQTHVEDEFSRLLDRSGLPPRGAKDLRGLLLGGGFGAGKSHVLEHLAQLAETAGFVVSHVVISKETPLSDPAKVFRAAVDAAQVPGGTSSAVAESAYLLDPGSPAYAELLDWAADPGLDERFLATLRLLPRAVPSDGEFVEATVRFWSGDPLPVGEVRRRLRTLGERRRPIRTAPSRDLARQRLRFAARLFAAAGHRGWVVLLDEVELIGRYPPLQRGRAYAELAGWLQPDPEDPQAPLVPVLAMTDDFEAAVLTKQGDREQIPAKLRAKTAAGWDEVAAAAETGMRLIERQLTRLRPPEPAELDRTYAALKELHGRAFGWGPPDVAGLERLGANRMRQYVRAWINEWDLTRRYPAYQPQTTVVPLRHDYREDPDLEASPDPQG